MPHTAPPRARALYYLEAPLRFPRLVMLPAAAGLLAGGVLAVTVPPEYRASVLLQAQFDPAESARLARAGIDLPSRRLDTVRRLVGEPGLLENVLRDVQPYGSGTPPAVQLERLRSRLHVAPMGSNAYVVEFGHREPRIAAAVPERVADQLVSTMPRAVVDRVDSLEGRVAAARLSLAEKALALERARAQGSEREARRAASEHELAQRDYEAQLEQLAGAARAGSSAPLVRFERLRAGLPAARTRPAWAFVFVGLVAGIFAGVIAAFVAERLDDRVKGPEDLAHILAAPLLATVPAFTARGEPGSERGLRRWLSLLRSLAARDDQR